MTMSSTNPKRRLFASIFLPILASSWSSAANSQAVQADNVRALALIRQMALDICPSIDQRSFATVSVREQRISSHFGYLISNLMQLNIIGSRKIQSIETFGPIQQHLAGLIKSNYECRLQVLQILNSKLLGAPPKVAVNRRIEIVSVPKMPPRPHSVTGGSNGTPIKIEVEKPKYKTISAENVVSKPILRVFLKNNMTSRDVVALAKLLPLYDVRLGKSGIDPSKEADTLFVNRDRVKPDEVIEVMRAMSSLGIPIKTIQQMPVGGRREIQVGTVIDPQSGSQIFGSVDGIDIDSLSRMNGNIFWKAGLNGHPFCPAGIGFVVPCKIDLDARPTY